MTTMRLGYAVGTGEPVDIPLKHMVVSGATQEAGKTTTLEALVARSGVKAIAFVTKRGEGAFKGSRYIRPYYRDRADWQFVNALLEAELREKNKQLRPFIMRICRSTKTLEDVWKAVKHELQKSKGGYAHDIYTQLDAYLELIVPEIRQTALDERLDIQPGLNVMDVTGSSPPMQMLLIQSAIDWVNEREKNTVVVVPEAWEYIPEGKGSPVKASAIALARKGAGLGNYIWSDSQDLAGLDKTILRQCSVWLLGVQREANEIKRNLANIPPPTKKPKASDVALLGKGEFYACWGPHCVKTYVQPAWMGVAEAQTIARGELNANEIAQAFTRRAPIFEPTPPQVQQVFDGISAMKQGMENAGLEVRDGYLQMKEESKVTEKEAQELREENSLLRDQIKELERRLEKAKWADTPTDVDEIRRVEGPLPGLSEELYRMVRDRLAEEAPMLLRVIIQRPELEVRVERKTRMVDGSTLPGRVTKLLAEGFFDEAKSTSAVRTDLKRTTGSEPNFGNLSRTLGDLVRDGFLTKEPDGSFRAVAGMKVNIVEAA